MSTAKDFLEWHSYDQLTEMLYEMINTKDQSDVTLVCDGNKQFKAHKIVLSACSTVFENMFCERNQNDSIIHLVDVQHQEMEAILHFMYLGVTSIKHEIMNEFFNVAKNLEIKEILNSIESEYQKVLISNTHADEPDGYNMEDSDRFKMIDDDITKTRNCTDKQDESEEESTSAVAKYTSEDKIDDEGAEENYSSSKTCLPKSEILSDTLDVKAANDVFAECNIPKIVKEGHETKQISILMQPEGIKYVCNQCNYQAKSHVQLRNHINSKHEGTKKDVCNLCGFQASFETIRRHKEFEHLGVKYVCDLCDYQAKRKDTLLEHMNSKHEGVAYHCLQCDFKTAYKRCLNKHIESMHEDKKYVCVQCDYEFSRKDILHQHIKTKHEGKRYACDQCDFKALKVDHLHCHIETKHKAMVCIKHNKDVHYPCPMCDYLTAKKINLTSHIQSKHKVEEGVRYLCNQCEHKAISQYYLKRHIESVHEGVKYPCNQCDHKAISQSLLKRHIESVHWGVKYPCSQCDYKATRQSYLKTHRDSKHKC